MDRRSFVGTLSAAMAGGSLSMQRVQGGGSTPPAPIRIRRLSWAGVQLVFGDRTLLIDPLLNPRAWQPTWTAPVVPIELTTSQVTVLITHTHPDHFDPAAIREVVGERGGVLCLASKAQAVSSRGVVAHGLQHNEVLGIGPWSVVPVPAEDGNGEEQVSWVVRGGGRRFIHCGDTIWHGNWWRIGSQYGPFDLAFLPINGADLVIRQPYVDVPASMTPDQATAAAVVLRAQSVCPIHYGFEDPQRLREFPNALATFQARASARSVTARIIPPGEWIEIPVQRS